MNKRQIYFKLFSECIPIKGYKESIICNLNSGGYFSIPNDLFDILQTNRLLKKGVIDLKKHYKNEICNAIDAYFNLFERNRIGHYTTDKESYEDIDLNHNSPSDISNSIISIDKTSSYNYINLIYDLESLGCNAIELRFSNVPLKTISDLLKGFADSSIKCFNLMIEYNQNINQVGVENILKTNKRVRKIIVHSLKDQHSIGNILNERVTFVRDRLIEYNSNVVFVINLESFTEAISFNMALNKKVCFDINGNILNHINHTKRFGNICNESLSIFLENNIEFKKNWYINNDKIEICKDCQYRYICFHTSEIEINNSKYIKISPCNFNPYENKFYN